MSMTDVQRRRENVARYGSQDGHEIRTNHHGDGGLTSHPTADFKFRHEDRNEETGKTFVEQATGGVPPYVYASTTPAVATINNVGMVSTISAGETYILGADSDGNAGSFRLTVSAAPVIIDPSDLVEDLGQWTLRRVTGGRPPYTAWADDPDIARHITGHPYTDEPATFICWKVGETYINVRDSNGATGRYKLTVKNGYSQIGRTGGLYFAKPGDSATVTFATSYAPYEIRPHDNVEPLKYFTATTTGNTVTLTMKSVPPYTASLRHLYVNSLNAPLADNPRRWDMVPIFYDGWKWS